MLRFKVLPAFRWRLLARSARTQQYFTDVYKTCEQDLRKKITRI